MREKKLFLQPLSSALVARPAAALGRRPRERVVAGGDVGVVAEHDGAGEHVQRVPVDPLVVVALVELVALRRVTEEAGPVAHLGPDRVVEGSEPAGAELVPVVADEVVAGAGVELAQDGGLLLVRSREGGDSAGRNALRRASGAAAEPALLPTSAGQLRTLGWDGREPRSARRCAEAGPASA